MANSLWRQLSKERHSSYVITEKDVTVSDLLIFNRGTALPYSKTISVVMFPTQKWVSELAVCLLHNHILYLSLVTVGNTTL